MRPLIPLTLTGLALLAVASVATAASPDERPTPQAVVVNAASLDAVTVSGPLGLGIRINGEPIRITLPGPIAIGRQRTWFGPCSSWFFR